jgi:hypothetical protein
MRNFGSLMPVFAAVGSLMPVFAADGETTSTNGDPFLVT